MHTSLLKHQRAVKRVMSAIAKHGAYTINVRPTSSPLNPMYRAILAMEEVGMVRVRQKPHPLGQGFVVVYVTVNGAAAKV